MLALAWKLLNETIRAAANLYFILSFVRQNWERSNVDIMGGQRVLLKVENRKDHKLCKV